uniref:Uncharacterized protein n=1 Tax=Ditylenchus dipsaci TaxID=166011 RepID=A0A915E8I2_9BILA
MDNLYLQVNNESTNEWWLQSSSSSPATSDPPTTSQPLSRSSLVMMQQEEYPKEELSYSKKQLYPWERQRELLVPFSSTKSAQSDSLHKQVTFANKNLQLDKRPKPEEHLSTLQPFPPIMPGASFYVDQHVSHGHYGREPPSNGHPAVVYDPNVLQSRYGFSGMLPQSSASVIAPLTALKKNRKATTFGVQNLPIVGAGEAPLTNRNQQMIDASNAVFFFFIPLPKRLSTAKAIKVRAQANSTFVGDNLPLPQLPFLTSATTKQRQQFPTLVHQWEDLSSATTHPSSTGPISEKRRTMSMEFNNNHLNWRPLGSGPKKLGPTKLVPLPSLMESNSVAEGIAPHKDQSLGRKLEVESYDDFNPASSNNCSSKYRSKPSIT